MEFVWWGLIGIALALCALAVLGYFLLGLSDAVFGREDKDYYGDWDLEDEDF